MAGPRSSEATARWDAEVAALRDVLATTGLDETTKWGKPCFVLGDANVAIIQPFTAMVALLFFKGVLLDDPTGVLEEQGEHSHAARRVAFRSLAEVASRAEVVRALVASAIEVERAGIPLPPRPDLALVEELQERLAQDPDLAAAFDELTPGRQRAYHLHVAGAKQAATRRRRVEEIVPRILAGKGLRDR